MTSTTSQTELCELSEAGLEQVKACPFCDASEAELELDGVRDIFFHADPGGFAFNRCTCCKSLWMPVRPVGDRLLRAYANYYTHQPESLSKQPNSLKKSLASSYVARKYSGRNTILTWLGARLWSLMSNDPTYVDWQMRFLPMSPAKVLDFGCGGGGFIARIGGLGYEALGVDFDIDAVALCRSQGLTVFDVILAEDYIENQSLDAVTINHVIEHVPDPRQLLQQVYRWLKPGGRVYIECPNSQALGQKIFGRYWRGLEVPRHFAIPSADGIGRALEETGFTVDRQVVPRNTRRLLWPKSLEQVPDSQRADFSRALDRTEPETISNAEYLGFVISKLN